MHEMELGYKPRIFTFLNIWQDVGEPSKMPNDGFARVGVGGVLSQAVCPAFLAFILQMPISSLHLCVNCRLLQISKGWIEQRHGQ